MSHRMYAKFLQGLDLMQVEVAPQLQAFAKRTNCWIDFNADGFFAGHARSTLVSVYWWGPSQVYVSRPKTMPEAESLKTVMAALGFPESALERVGMNETTEFILPSPFTRERATATVRAWREPQEGRKP